MRKIFRMTVGLALALACMGIARAEIIPPLGMGQIGYDAVVLCEELTIRREPSAGSGAVQTLSYGERLMVDPPEDGWCRVFLSDDVDASSPGWVNADYLAIDPAWYVTEGKTPVYAWDDASAPRVALLNRGARLPILLQRGEWYVVSLRGAVGWIHG